MRRALQDLTPSLIRKIHAQKRASSLDLSLGEPSLRIEPELWRRGLARYEREPQGYTPNLGLPSLRAAIAAHHALPGKSAAENVIVTVGSEQALFLAFFGLLDAGDEVIIADPAYPAYAGLATMCGARALRVPLRAPNYALCAADIAARLTERTRLVIVSAPSNPFGRTDSEAELRALAAACGAVPVLSDEIYRDLSFATPPPSIAAFHAASIVVSGLSKNCAMTGHRLGYLIADTEVVQALWPVQQLSVTAAATLSQQIALEAFLEPRFLRAHQPIYAERWRHAQAALDMYKIPYIEPDGAFYVMCPVVPTGVDAMAFCESFLKREDVVSVPGTAFGPSGAPFIRLSFAGEPATFAEAARRLAALSL